MKIKDLIWSSLKDSIKYFPIYTVLGAGSMTFEPVGHSKKLEFNLSSPDINDKRKLTVKWGDRTVTYDCPLVDDRSKSFSSMYDHAQFGDQEADNLIPLKLSDDLTVYIVKPKDNSDALEILKQANQLTNLERDLNNWRSEREITPCVREYRRITINLILNCYESFENMLNLSGNFVISLPECISQLTNLKTLMAHYTELKSLPESIGQLKALQVLDLTGNDLSALPESIGQLTNLVQLELSNNQLTSLPEWLDQLSNLKFLIVRNNPLRSLPSSLLNLNPDLSIDLTGHNLSEEVFNNLLAAINERTAQGLSTPRIYFDMPPPRTGSEPKPLEQSIDALMEFAEIKTLDFDISAFKNEGHQAKLWLNNLLETSDFTTGSVELKKQLAIVVLNIFKFAAKNVDFRAAFKNFLEEAVVSCVDRVTLSVIELEILVRLKELSGQKLNKKEVLDLIRSAQAIHLLNKFAEIKLATMRLSDPLDVHLGFLIHCKKPLEAQGVKLPFTSEHMQFFGITNITAGDIRNAVSHVMKILKSKDANKQLVQFLFLKNDLDTPIAQACLELFETQFPEEIKSIKDKMHMRIEEIVANDTLNESQMLTQINAIQSFQKDQYVQILEQLDKS